MISLDLSCLVNYSMVLCNIYYSAKGCCVVCTLFNGKVKLIQYIK